MEDLRLYLIRRIEFVMEGLDLPCYDYAVITEQKNLFFNEVYYPTFEFLEKNLKPIMDSFRFWGKNDYTLLITALKRAITTVSEMVPCYQGVSAEAYREMKNQFPANAADLVINIIAEEPRLAQDYQIQARPVTIPEPNDVVYRTKKVFTKPLNRRETEIFQKILDQAKEENKKYEAQFQNSDEKLTARQLQTRRADQALAFASSAVQTYRDTEREASLKDFPVKPTTLTSTRRLSIARTEDLIEEFRKKYGNRLFSV